MTALAPSKQAPSVLNNAWLVPYMSKRRCRGPVQLTLKPIPFDAFRDLPNPKERGYHTWVLVVHRDSGNAFWHVLHRFL